MLRKKAVITGAYGAIGKGICSGLAMAGFDLILIGKNGQKLGKLSQVLEKQHPESEIQYSIVDLANETEIKRFSEQLATKVDVLINNAATCPQRRTESEEGLEMQFAVNILGYVRMMLHVVKKMNKGGRIVNVASYWAGGLDLSDMEFRHRPYDNDSAYRQSKQANRMLSSFFAEQYAQMSISVNACHPGDVNSKLSNDLGFGGHQTPQQGAETPVWLASSETVEGISGKYFEFKQAKTCTFSQNREKLSALYELCMRYRRQE